MAVEVEELYSNLNKLLHDICKFLTDETTYEKLSPNSRQLADELISRSKHQLQQISKITTENNDYDGAYVDMERKSEENDDDDDRDNIYSSVTEIAKPTVVLPRANPYADLPAKELSQNIKYGSLSWRCKIILKFEKMRRIHAGIHKNWLLIYSSERDSKPLQTFYLKFHKAQNAPPKQNKNLPQDFELISTVGERKSYYFVALTHKDMLQWITHINRCYDALNKPEEEPSFSDDDISETYDFIIDVCSKENEDKNKITIKPPDLPTRRSTKTNTPLPPVPTAENDDESEDDTYDPVKSEIASDNSSFSEDSEENIYEPFVNKVSENKVSPKTPQNGFTSNKPSDNGRQINDKQKSVAGPSDIGRQINDQQKSVTGPTDNIRQIINKQKPVTPVKPKYLNEKRNNIRQ